MAKLNNKQYDKRVLFPSGKQKEFLNRARKKLGFSWKELALKLKVHQRTLNDWKRERYTIPLKVFNELSSSINPDFLRNINIKEPFWYVSRGSKIGGLAVLKKYGYIGGDPEYRKKKWREWWQEEGQYKRRALFSSKAIKIPRFSSKLAEFTGIVMGDGSLTDYQLELSFHSKTDRDYGLFVKELIEELFGVTVSVNHIKNKNAIKLLVSRKKLVNFCNNTLGLPIGNKLKQGLDIPTWVQESPGFQKACIRGLVDTDGCLFNERHKIKGRTYNYKRLNFTSYSPNLRQSVYIILKNLGFAPRLRGNRSVQIEETKKIEDYFKIIGSNNPKHTRRFMEEYR